MFRYTRHLCGKRFYHKNCLQLHQLMRSRQGHEVSDCASCQEDLRNGSKPSSLVSQEEQPSTASDCVNGLLTAVHPDLHLLSSRDN